MKLQLYIVGFLFLLVSCTNNVVSIKNNKKGKVEATYQLVENSGKKFYLDSETAPKSPYMQMTEDSLGRRILTFLNLYKNAIYLYNYEDTSFVRKIVYKKEDGNAVSRLSGYYIKNSDSIYVYNMPMTEVILTNSSAEIKEHISLRGSDNKLDWFSYYPQYLPSTVNPFLLVNDILLLTGQLFSSIPATDIDRFKFTACINTHNNMVEFRHTYPKEIYGNGVNWEGGIPTRVYPTLSAKGELIHSFPASHDLYLSRWDSDTTIAQVYGGSNNAGTIHSIDYDDTARTPDNLIISNFLHEDMYGAIIYDPYRKVYYRFLLQGIPNATIATSKEEKPINIIIMDENFNYLGETVIGTGKKWNWTNSFVTCEGLNIEYIDNEDTNEDYLNFRIFIPELI